MTRALLVLGLMLWLATSAVAAPPSERTFGAPVEKVWTTTEAVLKHLGWDIDKSDRSIGFITTESRRVERENGRCTRGNTRTRGRLDRSRTWTTHRSPAKRRRQDPG